MNAAPALPQARGADGFAAHFGAAVARVAAADDPMAEARAVVDGWLLTERELATTLTPGYAELADGYAAAFAAGREALARRLAALSAQAGAEIVTRTAYADEPSLSTAQIRLRWALPTGNPGQVAFVLPPGGAPAMAANGSARGDGGEDAGRVQALWVHTGARWGALIGFYDVVARRVRQRAGSECFAALDPECRFGRCSVEIYRVFDAVLRGDDVALGRACGALGVAPTSRND